MLDFQVISGIFLKAATVQKIHISAAGIAQHRANLRSAHLNIGEEGKGRGGRWGHANALGGRGDHRETHLLKAREWWG
jgi:hypothetical protein